MKRRLNSLIYTGILFTAMALAVSCTGGGEDGGEQDSFPPGVAGKLSGDLLPNILLHLKDSDGKIIRSALSEEDGSFVLDDIESGDYTVDLEKDGFAFIPPTTEVSVFDSRISGVDFEVEYIFPTQALATPVPIRSFPAGGVSVPSGDTCIISSDTLGKISFINTQSNTVQDIINVEVGASDMLITPDGKFLYIANTVSNSISALRMSGFSEVVPPIAVGQNPVSISVTPEGAPDEFVFVANYGDNSISAIRTAVNVETVFSLPAEKPVFVQVDPAGEFCYVAINTSSLGQSGGKILRVRVSNFEVLADPIELTFQPRDIVFTKDGLHFYVSNGLGASTVSVFRTDTQAKIKDIAVGNDPVGLRMMPNGKVLYVCNSADNTISIIRVEENAVIRTIRDGIGNQPWNITLTIDRATHLVRGYVNNKADSSVTVLIIQEP